MAWNSGWDDIFRKHEWGKYPSENLVRYVGRNFYTVKDRSAITILEVGCGTGANLWYLAREGFSVYGIDGSNVAIERAAKRLKQENLEADLRVGDIMQLPYENESFDVVIDIECIYANSLKDSTIIMQEINRVLKVGGSFFSITFMTGTYGDGNGIQLEGEPNTYLEIHEGALKKGYGIIRFTSEEDIYNVYNVFQIDCINYIIRSEKNRSYEVREWVISCRKKANIKAEAENGN